MIEKLILALFPFKKSDKLTCQKWKINLSIQDYSIQYVNKILDQKKWLD